jgi:hypothetical protein
VVVVKKWSALLSLAVALVLVAPAVSLADHGQDVARGNYRAFFNQEISFSASSNANTTQADGRFKWVLPAFDPDVIVEGDVDCLVTAVANATIGGTVTRIRPSGAFTNVQGFRLTVTDTGKFASAADLTSFVDLEPLPVTVCTPITFQSPINEGEIIVHDSL